MNINDYYVVQSVLLCMLVWFFACPVNIFWTKWSFLDIYGKLVQFDTI